MSHSVYADVVPYVAHNIWEGDPVGYSKSDPYAFKMLFLCNTDYCLDLIYECDKELLDNLDKELLAAKDKCPYQMNGWTNMGEERVGKHKNVVSGCKWKKDDYIVHVVNESQYSNGGHFEVSIVSDREKDIEEFANDMDITIRFGIDGPNEAVRQSW